MILKLNTYNHCFLGDSAFKYYVVENNDYPILEGIQYLGEDLDIEDPKSYDLAIDFLNDCKESDSEICDAYKYGMADIFLGTIFVSNLEKIHDTINKEIDEIIEGLRITRDGILQSKEGEPIKCCEGCCTCKDDKCPVEEEEVEDDSAEEASNTRTLYWAQQYMDTVIDPKSELSDADFNTFLAMFTQYGDWLLKQ